MSQDSCKRTLEVTVPVAEVEQETSRVLADVASKVNLPGFRPGKAPLGVVKSRFADTIRQEVLESLIPKAFRQQADAEGHKVVGTPNVTDMRYNDGEPLWFKAEFEVAPEFDVDDYDDVEIEYADPIVSDDDIQHELKHLQEDKAEYVNLDPRPLADGDFAVVSLKSLSGVEPPMEQDEVQLEIGSENTVAGFSENLRGLSPDEEKVFSVSYPEDYAAERLAGKTVEFEVKIKGLRRKELPELNDDFAKDIGDFQTIDELKERIRQQIFANRQYEAQREAKQAIVEKLVDLNQFAVPEAYVDRQIENNIERQLRQLQQQGLDPSKLKLDWNKIKESQGERALREVRGALIVDKVSEVESVQVTQEELDQQVQMIARQERQPVPAIRARMEKDGTLNRLVGSIRAEKTLQLLFERARKVAPSA